MPNISTQTENKENVKYDFYNCEYNDTIGYGSREKRCCKKSIHYYRLSSNDPYDKCKQNPNDKKNPNDKYTQVKLYNLFNCWEYCKYCNCYYSNLDNIDIELLSKSFYIDHETTF